MKEKAEIYFAVVVAMIFAFVIAASVVMFYIKYRQKLHRQTQAMHEAEVLHQKQLLHTTIESQEIERKRIGRDLHDEVNTGLSHLRMLLQQSPLAKRSQQNNQSLLALIDRIAVEVRNISHNLSPPTLELFGLAEALDELCESFDCSENLTIQYHGDAHLINLVKGSAALHLFRVLQELFNNTVRHAAASRVFIDWTKDNDLLHIRYWDDGSGFDLSTPPKKGMGLSNIESRLDLLKAAFKIETSEKKGFFISIRLPLNT